MTRIKRILVANRGEIACRIIKTCKKLHIESVAIYSEADRLSAHVKFADWAYCVGEPKPSESYLNIPKILEIAIRSNCDAIHPGYGFLSENPEFAAAVEKSGITFIGPNAQAMRIMGNKLTAKEAVAQYDVPLVPGSDHAIKDIQEAKQIAQEIGFPVLIKAAAGGGGKGMRIVKDIEEFQSQFERAVSEAESSFGDPSVFVEKYIEKPRHIEVQILGDRSGHLIYLGERECSIQRRHQKVIEEAPSVIINQELRKKLGETAINVAKACHYTNAGTVEFIMDPQFNFYFLEMNTRLQVEHPVTEMVTGLDLVAWQIAIAAGQKLNINQAELELIGHSIELRVYAEDPFNDFLPSIGSLTRYTLPDGEGIRVDDAAEEGDEISIYYDPMISKLIVHGTDRKTAIDLMKKAITHYQISGVATTLPFGLFVMNHPEFIAGNFDTHFIDRYFHPKENQPDEEAKMEMILAARIFDELINDVKVPKTYQNGWANRNSS